MKSLVDTALARHAEESKLPPPPPVSKEDEELAKLVESLAVSIKIIGCGGGGSNTIARLADSGISGAQLLACNTDAKHLLSIHGSFQKILLGKKLTKGLGAGALPKVGEEAAKEAEDELRQFIEGGNIVFLTAGLGGGTGTGSAHFIADLAREKAALTLAIVTMPFKAEGLVRMEAAERGLQNLRHKCDTVVVIPNDKLLELVPRLPLEAAFKVADEVLMTSIKGMTEIITKPGLVNLDYNDMMTVMKGGGVAMIGLGESDADRDRVDEAIKEALASPLLGNIDISDASGCLIRVVGGPDMTVSEAERAASTVGAKINPKARIIWGCSIEPEMQGQIKIMLIITGVKSELMSSIDARPAETEEGVDVVA